MDKIGANPVTIRTGTPSHFTRHTKKNTSGSREFANYQKAEQAIAEASEDYNNERIHSAIGYKTPAEFAAEWEAKHK